MGMLKCTSTTFFPYFLLFIQNIKKRKKKNKTVNIEHISLNVRLYYNLFGKGCLKVVKNATNTNRVLHLSTIQGTFYLLIFAFWVIDRENGILLNARQLKWEQRIYNRGFCKVKMKVGIVAKSREAMELLDPPPPRFDHLLAIQNVLSAFFLAM